MRQSLLKSCVSLAVLSAASLAAPAFAADPASASAPAAKADDDTLGTIVVTASTGNKTKLDSSVSISSVDASIIQDFHPMSEGDMLRLLPGLQPNISGPGGNGNFAVRGLPVATGGATFVQLQEDGLPQVLYGDIQFGNNDYWTKSSPTDERVEAIRGGTASTLASQAPGAVINYISKTSRSEGGYVELERGVNYDYTKLNFLDSGIINDTMYYNIGGFYDVGHGPRHASYNVSNSYLIKGNVTKELSDGKGYVRLLFKLANTQEPNDPGGLICGTINNNVASNLSTCGGLNIKNQSIYSLNNANVAYVGYNNNALSSQPLNGITTKQKSLQAQVHYEFADNIKLDENARYSDLSGGFASNFLSINPLVNTTAIPASATFGGTTYSFAGVSNFCQLQANAQYLAYAKASGKSISPNGLIGSCVNGQTVASAVYAAGVNAGKAVAEPYYDNNVEVFTNLRDMGSFVNDLKLSGKFDLGGGLKASLTAGWFFMSQRIAQDWHPNQFNAQVAGNDPSPIDVYNSSGSLLSANGYTGYNDNWGGGPARTVDYTFTDNAPYVDLILDKDKFELDASLREDINHGSGSGTNSVDQVYNSAGVYAPSQTINQTVIDPVTGKPTIVAVPYYLADSAPEVMNYTKSLLSWSVGASYKAMDNLNLFVRASRGTRFNADRMGFSGYFNGDGTLNTAGQTAVADYVNQYEIGLKNRGRLGDAHYTVELTVYHSNFNITTYELNPNVCGPAGTCIVADKYRTTGVEFYGTLRYGNLNVLANATFNKADKEPTGSTVFSRSNGIPDLAYSVAANYNVLPNASIGVDVTGVTSELNSNGVQFPGSAIFGANLKYSPVKNLQVGINVYNLFNTLALMGPDNANEIGTGGNNFVGTASSVIGRTATASVKFNF